MGEGGGDIPIYLITGALCVCGGGGGGGGAAEWLSSYTLGLTTPGLRVQTQH